MRKTLSFLLTCLMLLTMLPPVAMAEAEPAAETETAVTGTTEDGFAYSILNDEVTITGYTGEEVAVTLPDTIEDCPVVAVGDSAFAGNTTLQEVILPETLITIGNSAFANCTSLSKVTLQEGLEEIQWWAFRRTAIAELALPASLTTLRGDVFDDCQQLTTILLPANLHTVDTYTFDGCAALAQIDVAEENTQFASYEGVLYSKDMSTLIRCPEGKVGEHRMPEEVTEIKRYAFRDCTQLTLIEISEGVTDIAGYTFYGCSGLETVYLPSGIITIGDSAFEGCASLKQCAFPSTLKEIKGDAFSGCASLKTIKLPIGMHTLGDRVFYQCTALEDVTLSTTLTFIGGGILSNTAYYDNEENWTEGGLYWNTFLLQVKWTTSGALTIQEGTTLIASNAVMGNTNITSVSIPASLKYVGYSVFSGCTGLQYVDITDVGAWCGIRQYSASNPLEYAHNLRVDGEVVNDLVIPWGPTRIEQLAFSGCDGLTSVTIPGSVEVIDLGAFYECKNLKTVTMPSSVTDVDESAFVRSPVETLKVTGEKLTTPMLVGCSYTLKKIELPDTLTTIAANFSKAPLVTSLTIPASVTEIQGLFQGSGITTLNITDLAAWCAIDMGAGVWYDGPTLYVNGTKLTDLVIPDGVTKINNHVFSGYRELTSVTIPDSVTEVGQYAFERCTGLTKVTVQGQPKCFAWGAFENCTSLNELYIGDVANWCAMEFEGGSANPLYYAKTLYIGGAYAGRLVIPDGVTTIGAYTFVNAKNLTGVVIPDSVTEIGQYAFGGSVDLRDVLIEDLAAWCAIEFKGRNPLSTAENLYINDQLVTKLVFPEDVTSIGDHAFDGFASLTEVTLPANLGYIGMDAFANCAGLTTLTVPELSGAEASNAFDNSPIKTLIIADGAKTVSSNMVAGRPTLEQVIIPDSVTEIGYGAFTDCPVLAEMTILPHVTKIANKSIGYDMFGQPVRKVTLTGYRNTAAEDYAAENNFTFVALNQSCEDKTTGITVEETASAALPEGATLIAQVVETTEDEVVFEIRLEQDGVTVQPNGDITVTIPVPEGMTGDHCKVYRREEDGALTDMQATYADSQLVFTTNHFSEYVVKEVEEDIPTPTPVIYGDVDSTPGVTAADALLALQAATGKVSLDAIQQQAADVDNAAGLSANDALLILQYATKKITAFPAEK